MTSGIGNDDHVHLWGERRKGDVTVEDTIDTQKETNQYHPPLSISQQPLTLIDDKQYVSIMILP